MRKKAVILLRLEGSRNEVDKRLKDMDASGEDVFVVWDVVYEE